MKPLDEITVKATSNFGLGQDLETYGKLRPGF